MLNSFTMKCAVKGCGSTQHFDWNLSFHRFPKRRQWKYQWVQACGFEELWNEHGEIYFNKKRICSLHFEPTAYIVKGRLKENAMPTIFGKINVPLHREQACIRTCRQDNVKSVATIHQQAQPTYILHQKPSTTSTGFMTLFVPPTSKIQAAVTPPKIKLESEDVLSVETIHHEPQPTCILQKPSTSSTEFMTLFLSPTPNSSMAAVMPPKIKLESEDATSIKATQHQEQPTCNPQQPSTSANGFATVFLPTTPNSMATVMLEPEDALSVKATHHQEQPTCNRQPSSTSANRLMTVLPIMPITMKLESEDVRSVKAIVHQPQPTCGSPELCTSENGFTTVFSPPTPNGRAGVTSPTIKLEFEDQNLEAIGYQPQPQKPSTSRTSHGSVASTQTSKSLSADTPRKRKLKCQLKHTQRKIRQLQQRVAERSTGSVKLNQITKDEFLHVAKRFLPEKCLGFIEMQIGMRAHTRGNRYSAELKHFALILYFLSPQSYQFLRRTFCLPSLSVLRRLVGKVSITPGLSDCVLHLLEYKFKNLKAIQKHCTLCVDEIPLKPHLFYNRKTDKIVGVEDLGDNRRKLVPAKNALVFMLKSIGGGWKQPISYYVLRGACPSNEIKTILLKTIGKLETIGIQVHCVVSDQSPNFLQLRSRLGVTVEKPYFDHHSRKIFLMYDVCHLIRSLRNHLIKCDFHWNDMIASWDDIKALYVDLKKRNLRLCSKLTDRHITPNNFHKKRVKLATQVFSYSVASAIDNYVTFGVLPSAATGTARFLVQVNHLFDLFNSSCRTGTPFKRAFRAKPMQVKLLQQCKDLLATVRIKTKSDGVDVTDSIECVQGLLQSIEVLPLLYTQLKECGIKELFSRRLTQDCIENLFRTIRQQSGNAVNPTTIQFERAFKEQFLLNFFEQSVSYNCDADDFDELIDFGSPLNSATRTFWASTDSPGIVVESLPQDIVDLPKKNCLWYVSKYIYNKCLERHSCDECVRYGQSGASEESNNSELHGLSTDFVNYINSLERLFRANFESSIASDRLSCYLKERLQNLSLNHPCQYFQLAFAQNLFIQMRIYYALKFFNKDLMNSVHSRKRNLLILKHL